MSDEVAEERYDLYFDENGAVRADIAEGVSLVVRMLAEDHERRVKANIHAFVIAEFETAIGIFRIRDIKVIASTSTPGEYFVRYRQWKTGLRRVIHGVERDEFLDVAGPKDRGTRERFNAAILKAFHQIREESASGVLAQAPRRAPKARLGDNPEIVARLQTVKKALESASAPQEPAPAPQELAVGEANVQVEEPPLAPEPTPEVAPEPKPEAVSEPEPEFEPMGDPEADGQPEA